MPEESCRRSDSGATGVVKYQDEEVKLRVRKVVQYCRGSSKCNGCSLKLFDGYVKFT
jgi:hypothetical protein